MILEILRENDFFLIFWWYVLMKIEFETLKAMSIVKYFTLMISLQIFREFNFMILKSVFSVNWFHEKIFKLCKFGEYKQKKIMKQTPSKIQTWIHAPVWKTL